MGKGARKRRERAGRLSLVFVDLDFDRASQPFGRGSYNDPMGWAVSRAGLVDAEWDGQRLRFTGDELIEGRHPASRLVAALATRRGLIVGHGLLRSDLPAVAMVTGIPRAVMGRTLDTLKFATRLRTVQDPGSHGLSTGCGLTDLLWENLQVRRPKPAIPRQFAGDPEQPVGRGDHDPREDAALVCRLWEHLVTARSFRWGPGMRYHGKTGTAALSEAHHAELLGKHTHPSTRGTQDAFTAGGPRANRMIAASLPAPTTIRVQAEKLQHDGLLTQERLSDEELLTACQWMGIGQNFEIRERIADGRALVKSQRTRLSQALWDSTHPEQIDELFQAYRENPARYYALMDEQAEIRAKLAAAVS